MIDLWLRSGALWIVLVPYVVLYSLAAGIVWLTHLSPLRSFFASCIGITGREGNLVGIITDGDLRRHMRPDLLNASVDEIMTRNPKTVRPDQLVSETLELLNSTKITALFVVDAEPFFVLEAMRDLLSALQ